MVVDILLVLIIICQLVMSYIERKDFNDRLMSKNFDDYKSHTVKDEVNKLPEEEGGIPIEDARELIDAET